MGVNASRRLFRFAKSTSPSLEDVGVTCEMNEVHVRFQRSSDAQHSHDQRWVVVEGGHLSKGTPLFLEDKERNALAPGQRSVWNLTVPG